MTKYKSIFGRQEYMLLPSKKDYMQYCLDNNLTYLHLNDDTQMATCSYPEGPLCILVVVDCDDDIADSVIVHECVHIWQEVCNNINEDKCGDEIQAYGIQEIFVNMMREYNKQVRGKR